MRAILGGGLLAASALIAGCGVAGNSTGSQALAAPELPPADDAPEPGLQGQVPAADQPARASIPGSDQANQAAGGVPAPPSYRRGTHLIPVSPMRIAEPNTGLGRGGNYEMAWLDDCAYVGMGDPVRQALNEQVLQGPGPTLPTSASATVDPSGPMQCEGGLPTGGDPCNLPDPPADSPQDGLAIVSVKDPAKPKLIYVMQLRITPRSPVLLGPTPSPPSQLRTSTATANPWAALHTNDARRLIMVGTANEVSTYQAVYNCKYPSRRSITDLGTFMAHGLRIAPDGMTAYLADQNADGVPAAPVFMALDLANVRQPAPLATFADADLGTGGLHNIDVSADGKRAYVTYQPSGPASGLTPAQGGVMVLDVSAVQARAAGAQVRKLGQLEWSGAAHGVRRARIGGHPYLLVTDSLAGPSSCPWGGVHVIDIANEAQPVEVGTFGLAVNDAANCNAVIPDAATYTAHSVSVDDPDRTRYAFFGWANSGLRIFDLSNPAAPVEVAYYNPPPYADTINHGASTDGGITLDSTLSSARYLPQANQIWFTSVANGFHVLQFTQSMGPAP